MLVNSDGIIKKRHGIIKTNGMSGYSKFVSFPFIGIFTIISFACFFSFASLGYSGDVNDSVSQATSVVEAILGMNPNDSGDSTLQINVNSDENSTFPDILNENDTKTTNVDNSFLSNTESDSDLAPKDTCLGNRTFNIALIGDPHLPGRYLEKKNSVIDTVNNWDDVDEVVIVGDFCETIGTDAEFAVARRFVSALRQPFELINGNHDYVFAKKYGTADYKMASIAQRYGKLERFRAAFGPLSKHKIVKVISDGKEYPYHLIYLGIDSLTSPYYSCLSEKTLSWFRQVLALHKDVPTIVFCHSPLWGKMVLKLDPVLVHVVTQPVEELSVIVKDNKQLFLWVAGHAHLGLKHKHATSYLNYFNFFRRQVYTVNNCDIDGRSILEGTGANLEYHEDIWTKSLVLHPDKVEVRVYDHIAQRWLHENQQTIKVGRGW